MVVQQVARENFSGVTRIQCDHMIKALASQRPDQPFDIVILPRPARRAQNFFDAVLAGEFHPISAVPEALHSLLSRTLNDLA
jgi:hypothetical protein